MQRTLLWKGVVVNCKLDYGYPYSRIRSRIYWWALVYLPKNKRPHFQNKHLICFKLHKTTNNMLSTMYSDATQTFLHLLFKRAFPFEIVFQIFNRHKKNAWYAATAEKRRGPLGPDRSTELWYYNVIVLLFKMDGWITCDFTSFSTVFQSYQDDVWMIMKGCVQWNSVYGWEDFTSSEDRTRSAWSVSQRLTQCFFLSKA